MGKHSVIVGISATQRNRDLARMLVVRGLDAVSTYAPGDQLFAGSADHAPAAIVLDGPLPSLSLRAMADAIGRRPSLRVVVVGPLAPNVDALIAVASGASGYVPQTSHVDEIAAAVEAVVRGDPALPPAVAVPMLQHLRSGGRGVKIGWQGGSSVELTGREWEVLVLLRQARTTAEIAERLVIARVTVRTHVASLVHKFGVADRSALAAPLVESSAMRMPNRPLASPLVLDLHPVPVRQPS